MNYSPSTALRHLRALATNAVPNCVNLDAIDRVVAATTFTEASTEEALLILDNARDASLYPDDHSLMMAIDMAIQKLRPVPAPVHNAEALEQLARQHPIDLPWMQDCPNQCEQAQGLPVCGGQCQKGGEGA